LDGDPDSRLFDTGLYKIAQSHHRSRWLVEASIIRLVETGFLPNPGPISSDESEILNPPSIRSWRDTEPREIRAKAAVAVNKLFPEDSPFYELLDIACEEYILVAQVPDDASIVYLEYEAPLLPAATRSKVGQIVSAAWTPPPASEFSVLYETTVPRGVDSHHLTMEVPPEILVRRFILSSDVDAPVTDALVSDIFDVADNLDRKAYLREKILELDLQSIASRLAELGRRRMLDRSSYVAYIQACFRRLQGPGPWIRKTVYSQHPAAGLTNGFAELATAKRFVSALNQFADNYEAGHMRKIATSVAASDLRAIAERLEAHNLQYDLYVDNDPRENAGHIQWRRRPFGTHVVSGEPVRLRVLALLADDAPSLAGSVTRMQLAIIALISLFILFLRPPTALVNVAPDIFRSLTLSDSQLSTADAVVTILLLVPGLMLTRLNLPSHKTVLGRLRLLPRYLAYGSVMVSCALAAATAVLPASSLPSCFAAAIVALLALLGIGVWNGIRRSFRRRILVPQTVHMPFWVQRELTRIPIRRRRWVTSRFSSIVSKVRNV
jgi:hypothetical protein